VIYDTLYGNTKQVAEAIAVVLGTKAFNVRYFKIEMLRGVSLLIVGCPIHAWHPSEATLNFIASFPPDSLKGMKIAAFDTRVKVFFSGSASDKVDKKLVSLGGKSVIRPGRFYVQGKEGPLVEGELENARSWAREILEEVET